MADHVAVLPGEPPRFVTRRQQRDITLEPLAQVYDERYAVYWKIERAAPA